MLQFSHVSLDIQDGSTTRRLLDDVSFSAAPGEVLGITGPSGSGKSTLLAIAGLLQPPTTGGVWLDDTSLTVTGREAAKIRREKIGIVFQRPNLVSSLSVREQLLLMPHLGRVLPLSRSVKRAAAERAEELLDAVGLAGMGDRRISELSGGQQARVNLARALMNSPELLLIDEPTAALDSHSADRVTDLILKLVHENQMPALYVSHDQEQIAKLDRTITVVDGRVQVPATV
ncbi:ABC transporter ATP-binding protein [Corynebacterium hindlerae]|uniref:ABC transporter ATP-binding protein n=1 Tax=Corynebacterium hindlerae TaxID=699041 RepID=UPI0031B6EBE9